jgi:hypothetical protein
MWSVLEGTQRVTTNLYHTDFTYSVAFVWIAVPVRRFWLPVRQTLFFDWRRWPALPKSKKGLVLIILAIVFKHQIKIKKYMFVYKFNIQSYTNMYFHIMIGTGSYTTSTTNMYNKHGFYLPRVGFPTSIFHSSTPRHPSGPWGPCCPPPCSHQHLYPCM